MTTFNGGTTYNDAGMVIYKANSTINNGHALDSNNDADYVVDGTTVVVFADDFNMDGKGAGAAFTDWELTNEGRLASLQKVRLHQK